MSLPNTSAIRLQKPPPHIHTTTKSPNSSSIMRSVLTTITVSSVQQLPRELPTTTRRQAMPLQVLANRIMSSQATTPNTMSSKLRNLSVLRLTCPQSLLSKRPSTGKWLITLLPILSKIRSNRKGTVSTAYRHSSMLSHNLSWLLLKSIKISSYA